VNGVCFWLRGYMRAYLRFVCGIGGAAELV